MRIFLAIWLAPNVFFYGTGLVRTDIQQRIAPFNDETNEKSKFKKIKVHRDADDVTKQRNYCGNYSKYYPGELRTDIDENGYKFVIKMNNMGFRGHDIIDKKEPGTIRIVTLGGSSTFGYRDRDDETYPYYLEEILNKHSNKIDGDKIKRYEVINLGIPTLKAENIWSLFMNEGLKLNPDIVTFYEGINDVSSGQDTPDLNKQNTRNKYSIYLLRTYRKMTQRSVLFAFTANLIDHVFTNYKVSDLASDKQLSKENHTQLPMELPAFFEIISKDVAKRQEAMTSSFLNNIDKINSECKKHHILFIISNQQVSSCTFAPSKLRGLTYQDEVIFVINKLRNNDKISLHQLHLLKHYLLMDKLRTWCVDKNIMFVDTIKALDQDRDTLITYVHLNSRGNKIIAHEFADKISSLAP